MAAITPSITWISDVNCGTVITTPTAGTLVLGTAALPSGVRSVTGGALLGGSPMFSLGAMTLTGAQGDAFTLGGSGTSVTLTGPSGRTMKVLVNTVQFTPTITAFPSGAANTTTTTPVQYFGLTVNVQKTSSSATGLYSGTLTCRVTDSVNGLSSSKSFSIKIKVDPFPIFLTKVADLAFGAVVTSATAGTAVLAPDGGRTSTGGVSLGAFSPGAPASFNVQGTASSLYAITLPASATLTAPTGGTLTVNAFTSSPSATGVLNPSGLQVMAVGATVNVAANQPEGAYAGTFPVTVFYQ